MKSIFLAPVLSVAIALNGCAPFLETGLLELDGNNTSAPEDLTKIGAEAGRLAKEYQWHANTSFGTAQVLDLLLIGAAGAAAGALAFGAATDIALGAATGGATVGALSSYFQPKTVVQIYNDGTTAMSCLRRVAATANKALPENRNAGLSKIKESLAEAFSNVAAATLAPYQTAVEAVISKTGALVDKKEAGRKIISAMEDITVNISQRVTVLSASVNVESIVNDLESEIRKKIEQENEIRKELEEKNVLVEFTNSVLSQDRVRESIDIDTEIASCVAKSNPV